MNVEDAGGVVVVFAAVIIYVGLIVLGIKIARSKNRSAHWMWFAIHPVGLITVLIVMACLRPLKECPQCAEKLKSHARVCSYCSYNFQQDEIRGIPAPNQQPLRNSVPMVSAVQALQSGLSEGVNHDNELTLLNLFAEKNHTISGSPKPQSEERSDHAKEAAPSSVATSAEEAIDRKVETWRQMGFQVGGVEAARQAAREADAARPSEPWFSAAVDKMVSIYREHPQGFVRGQGGGAEQELRNIGETLNDKGGMNLMRAAHAEFSGRCGVRGAARNLEFMWDGVGSWRG